MEGESESVTQTGDFTFALGEKDNVVLIVLGGKITHRQMAPLEEMESKIKEKEQRLLILNFKNVNSIMPGVHSFLVNFLKHARDAKKIIGLCELKADIKSAMISAGIFRAEEIFENIPEAWKELNSKLQKDSNSDMKSEIKNAA